MHSFPAELANLIMLPFLIFQACRPSPLQSSIPSTTNTSRILPPPSGVEARSGSRVTLSECVVSGSGRSGVFVQGFASALLKRCDVLGSSLAGVEALRCVVFAGFGRID